MRAGDKLLLSNGKYVVVMFVQHEILESPVKVYNFEVANNHNYYVAESIFVSADCFVLVYNSCYKYYQDGCIESKYGIPNGQYHDKVKGEIIRLAPTNKIIGKIQTFYLITMDLLHIKQREERLPCRKQD